MNKHILPSILLTLCFTVFFGGVYTLALWGIAQAVPNKGNGFLLQSKASKAYYANIGQKFTDAKYFWSRPSAVEYSAAGSGGSNKGPSNPDYLAVIQERIDTFIAYNPEVVKNAIPSDLVTASGSGLDPHISVQAAEVQVKRIAAVRGIPELQVRQLVAASTEKPLLGLFGPSRVHVLKLNVSLDQL